MEDKDTIIEKQAARIRVLEEERDWQQYKANFYEEEVNKLYARSLWERIFNIIPD